jgi:hypothetical protein
MDKENAVSQKKLTEIHVLALVKGVERYVFLFDDANRDETLRQIGRFASNPELSFTGHDAAVLSQKVRQTKQSDNGKPMVSSRFQYPLPFSGDDSLDWLT